MTTTWTTVYQYLGTTDSPLTENPFLPAGFTSLNGGIAEVTANIISTATPNTTDINADFPTGTAAFLYYQIGGPYRVYIPGGAIWLLGSDVDASLTIAANNVLGPETGECSPSLLDEQLANGGSAAFDTTAATGTLGTTVTALGAWYELTADHVAILDDDLNLLYSAPTTSDFVSGSKGLVVFAGVQPDLTGFQIQIPQTTINQHIVINEISIDSGAGGYVRWRPRMVRLSVFEDLKTTLASTGWIDADLDYPFEVKEFFPEFAVYVQDTVHVNTLTMDNGDPGTVGEYELGGLLTRVYRINFAFYAQDDETGIAVFSDLSDRYEGLTDSPYISLLNYNVDGDPPLITRLEVESFQYVKASLDVAPYEHHLWFAELIVRDFIDSSRTEMPS